MKLRNRVNNSVRLHPTKCFWYSILHVGSIFTSKNLISTDHDWIKFHPIRSSFEAWVLNYLYELTLTLTLTLNARNKNQNESGREQDSCRTKNQDFMAPAPYHTPLRGSECQSERAPALGENAFWSRVLDCGRETGMHRWTDQISTSLSEWS